MTLPQIVLTLSRIKKKMYKMSDDAKKFLKEYGLDNLPRTFNYPAFRGKYVFMLHDFNQNFQYGPIVAKRMNDFYELLDAGARVVDGIFWDQPKTIEPGFIARCGQPQKINEKYVLYNVGTLKHGECVEVPHMFVKDPYDKNFMKDMHDGDRATLENIIVNEKDDTAWLGWDHIERTKWCNYKLSKKKSEELLDGFDAFIWATTLLDVDKIAALNLLRYAREIMPCFLDSGFERYYDTNSQQLPYVPTRIKVTIWNGTEIVDQSR